MIVEFIGLPGAGKTTLEAELIRILKERGTHIFTREEITGDFIRTHIFKLYSRGHLLRQSVTGLYHAYLYSVLVLRLLRLWMLPIIFHKAAAKSGYWTIESAILTRHTLQHLRDGKPSHLVMMSEGFFHHLACLYAWAGPTAMKMLGEVPYDRSGMDTVLIIHVSVQKEVALNRLLKRGIPETWPSGANPEKAIESFSRAIEEILHFVDGLGAHLEQVSLDSGNTDIFEVASPLADKILERLSGNAGMRVGPST